MKSTKSKSRPSASSTNEPKASPKREAPKPKSKAAQSPVAPAKLAVAGQKASQQTQAAGKPKTAARPLRKLEVPVKKPKSATVTKTSATKGATLKKVKPSRKRLPLGAPSSKGVVPSAGKPKPDVPHKAPSPPSNPVQALPLGAAKSAGSALHARPAPLSPGAGGVIPSNKHALSEGQHPQPKATVEEPVLPSILFEGDPPAPPEAPKSPPKPVANAEPPAAPGPMPVDPAPVPIQSSRLSGKLLLVAQNPDTLFVYCDIPGSAMELARLTASGNKLFIRIHRHMTLVPSFQESEFPLGAHGVFIQVSECGLTYTAELGYYVSESCRGWASLLTSEPASTPEPKAADLVPEDPRFGDVLYLVQSAIEKQVPLVEVVQHLHLTGQLRLDELTKLAEVPWPTEYAAMLRDLCHAAKEWRRPSSLEFLRPLPEPKPSAEGAAASRSRGKKPNPTSPKPAGAGAPGRSSEDSAKGGFWFNVNVEIVVYGSTEPDAKVMLAGRPVKLAPDGSFSMRYSLPDGAYGMNGSATPADESEMRRVHLHFSRATGWDGEVGHHAQDPSLLPPG